MPDDSPGLSRDSKTRTVALGVVAIAATALLANAFVLIRVLNTWGDRGDFGSMFGAANALFSGLALGGVIYALTLQREELGLQREELRMTRQELRRAADAQERTERSVSDQARHMRRSAEIQLLAALIHAEAAKAQVADSPAARLRSKMSAMGLGHLERELASILQRIREEGG